MKVKTNKKPPDCRQANSCASLQRTPGDGLIRFRHFPDARSASRGGLACGGRDGSSRGEMKDSAEPFLFQEYFSSACWSAGRVKEYAERIDQFSGSSGVFRIFDESLLTSAPTSRSLVRSP